MRVNERPILSPPFLQDPRGGRDGLYALRAAPGPHPRYPPRNDAAVRQSLERDESFFGELTIGIRPARLSSLTFSFAIHKETMPLLN